MEFKIREIVLEDLPGLVPLVEQLGYRCTASDLVERYKSIQGNSILAAFTETGTPCGYVQVGIFSSLHFPVSIEVIALVVEEKVRGNGLGKRLMLAAEDWARKQGVNQVWLRSGIKRESAHAFYTSIGYSLTATSHKFEKEIGS